MKKQKYTLLAISVSILCAGLFSCDQNNSVSDGRYADVFGAQWGCHDPKLFQDDDGTYYVYSTGWQDGIQIRKSNDLAHWEKIDTSPLASESKKSDIYGKMVWDDDFLKWTGCATNAGELFNTDYYRTSVKPESWAPTVIKQDGKYYMLHGIVSDCQTVRNKPHRAGCITMAISDSPEGPFLPAQQYNGELYEQSSLVRCVWSRTKNQSPSEIGYEGCFNSCDENWNSGFGTIDPEFVVDIATGKLYIEKIGDTDCYAVTYGSWLGGIALLYVDSKTLKPVCTTAGVSSFDGQFYNVGDAMNAPADSISGNQGVKIAGGLGAAYEGAQVIFNSENGFFYIFVSMGNLFHEYRVGVGRSRKITGPYLDTSDNAMSFSYTSDAAKYHLFGGKILGAWQFGETSGDEYGFRSPGGQSILRDLSGRILLANHTRTNYFPTGNFTVQIHQMFFNENNWPVLNMNDFNGENAHLAALSKREIAGKYAVNLTRRAAHTDFVETTDGNTQEANAADGKESFSVIAKLAANGKIEGAYTGTWSTENGLISLTVFQQNGDFLGNFDGIVMYATDNARKNGKKSATVTFSALCSSEGEKEGEYIFGNKM